jgi:hypothetical protein
MKDDIDWPEECDISGINHVKIGERIYRRHQNTLRALYKLMKLELQMLTQITQEIREPGESSRAKSYIALFSAESLSKGKNEILFTKVMMTEFKNHLDWVYKQKESRFSKEWDSINVLLEDYGDIRSAFS